jgi:hypothetical protein
MTEWGWMEHLELLAAERKRITDYLQSEIYRVEELADMPGADLPYQAYDEQILLLQWAIDHVNEQPFRERDPQKD